MKVAKRLGKVEDLRIFAPDKRFVLPDCRLGLEFEWEGTGAVAERQALPVTDWSHYWTWHEERSLRNQGSEFVFSEPLFGVDAYNAIAGLCSLARESRWVSTMRTGIHVHLDVRDLSIDQLIGLSILYALFEKPIYRWVGDNRENNHFCLPWYKAEGSLIQASEIVRAAHRDFNRDEARVDPLFEAAEEYARYAGFNWNALARFGSVEARQLKTTHNVQKILDWINILQSLKRATYNIPTSDGALVDMVQRNGARQSANDLLGAQVFGLLDYDLFENDVQEVGVGVAEELIREGLTINLWNVLAVPKGENGGFQRFMEGLGNRPFVQPPIQGAMPQVRAGRNNNEMFNVHHFWLPPDEVALQPAAQIIAPQEVREVPARWVLPDAGLAGIFDDDLNP